MSQLKINPFRHEYFLGYINQVFPQYVKVHFPSSILLNGFTHFGEEFNGGLVGSFVIIEGDKNGFLGRITELSLPESERLSLNEKAFQTSDFHPTGKIEILLSFDLYQPLKVKKGLTSYPNIGAKVFVSSGQLVQEYMSRFGVKDGENSEPIKLGNLVSSPSTEIKVNLQSIFGRHCAVVGTTGGGKSYTVSKLIESLIETGNKAILIDATGEYDGSYEKSTTINIGDGTHVFHYSQLTIDDIFFLLRPSSKTQVPKLMEAIRSLKIVKLNNDLNLTKEVINEDLSKTTVFTKIENGLLKKAGSDKRPYEEFYFRNIASIEDGNSDFDIEKLTFQLSQECIWDSASKWEGNPRAKIDIPEKWGDRNESDISYCISLISRINNIINSSIYQNIFGFKKIKNKNDITNILDDFISSDNNLLRLNFGNIPFDFQVREILANAIGKYLLNKARIRTFKNNPIIVLMDEAHQFLNKSIKDEYFDSQPLDAFESIAKECRKHGLFLCIATQMPRDIPQGTLSQMGTFIVHRLINHNDKEAINNACSSANKNTLEFLPILGEGEAILTGVDFPMPIIMKFDKPLNEPNSQTPSLNKNI
ncbi:ATP-binding protein [Flavobacterium sp. WC2409]|uniref:ATP-binding protein n=1 Tax=Flavobacterium sp. WC2409 TaxID=3234139 RepID=A0AB39VZX4_9FLAO